MTHVGALTASLIFFEKLGVSKYFEYKAFLAAHRPQADNRMPGPLRGHRQQARPPKMQRILGVKWYFFGSRLAGDEAGTSHRTLNRCPLGVGFGRSRKAETGQKRTLSND